MKEINIYQKDVIEEGVSILNKYSLLYLQIEQRLGKTAISLKICEAIDPHKQIYFFTKRAVVSSILKDCKDFNLINPIKVISIDTLPNSLDQNSFIIIDEAHRIGGFPLPSKRASSLKRIINKQQIIYLSSTLVPQNPCQIYHQLYISGFSPFRKYQNFFQWANEYTRVIKYSDNTKYISIDVKIFRDIEHLCIRRKRSDMGFQIKEVKQHFLKVQMEKETLEVQKLYQQTYSKRILDRLNHQLCGGTLVELSDPQMWDYSKADYINDYFKDSNKIVIFYRFRNQRTLLTNQLNWRILDSTQEFNNSDERVAYLCQFQSKSQGIDLSASNTLIYYNVDYSCNNTLQSACRILNINKSVECHVYYLLSNLNVQQKILEKVFKKHEKVDSYYRI